MAEVSRLSAVQRQYMLDTGYSIEEIEVFWTDDLLDLYLMDMQAGVKPTSVVSLEQAPDITLGVKFWSSETGESVGAIMDALDIEKIPKLIERYAMYLAIGIGVVVAFTVLR